MTARISSSRFRRSRACLALAAGLSWLAPFVSPLRAQAPSASPSASAPRARPTPALGAQEIIFKNGKTFTGEVVAADGTRARLVPYEGAAFGMDWSAVKSARPLTAVEQVRARAAALEAKGGAAAAIKLLEPEVKAHPELAADIDRLAGKAHEKRASAHDENFKAYRAKLDDALDRRQLEQARELVKTELAASPADADVLGDAVMVDFLLHRAAGGKAADFKSANLDRLRGIDPKSSELAGVVAEMGRGETLEENFEKARLLKISTALSRAQELYKREQLGEAKGVLEEALALSPSNADARPMRELLGKIEGELAAERADQRDEQLKRLAAWRAQNPGAGQLGQPSQLGQLQQMAQQYGASAKDLDKLKDKRVERALQSARNGKARDLTPKR